VRIAVKNQTTSEWITLRKKGGGGVSVKKIIKMAYPREYLEDISRQRDYTTTATQSERSGYYPNY